MSIELKDIPDEGDRRIAATVLQMVRGYNIQNPCYDEIKVALVKYMRRGENLRIGINETLSA